MPAPSGGGTNPYVSAQPPMGPGMGGPGMGGARPGTGQRPGTGTGAGARPGSAARQGTAGGPKNFGGIGLNTAVSVEHRPVTQQGMRGSTAVGARAGPGRQIQDRNYFLGELRARCTEVEEETAKLSKQAAAAREDNQSYGALERKYEALSNEMRNLQGTLADYNLLLDRSRIGREPADIFDEVAQLKASNASDRQVADSVFNERQVAEGRIRELEGAMFAHSQRMAERMAEMEPAKRDLFARLQEEKGELLSDLPKKQSLLLELSERIAAAESAAARDAGRAELVALHSAIRSLTQRVNELRESADDEPLTAEQQRDKLLTTVKRQNAEIQNAEKAISEAAEQLKRHRSQLSSINQELAKAGQAGGAGGAGGAADKEAKYEQLLARDAEMQQLIDTFDETFASETARLDELRAHITAALTSISKQLEASATVEAAAAPGEGGVSASQLAELRSELSFKAGQMEAAERTAQRLVAEKEKRYNELEKIKTLDAKISHELGQLNDKMASMQSELASFKDIRQLKEEAEARRQQYTEARGTLKARQEAARRAGVHRKAHYEQAKAALADDQTASGLEALEQKLRHYESTVFMLQEYVHAKGRESDFATLKGDCENMLNTINRTSLLVMRDR